MRLNPFHMALRHALEDSPYSIRRAAKDRLQSHRVGELLSRRVITRGDVTGDTGISTRTLLSRNPARRELHRLTGVYMPEEQAEEILNRISDHQWIQAEKAQRNIWAEHDPQAPRRAAALDWMHNHFSVWQRWQEASASGTN